MQSCGCEHTHPGAKECEICGLMGRDGGMGHMLSIGREKEQILGDFLHRKNGKEKD